MLPKNVLASEVVFPQPLLNGCLKLLWMTFDTDELKRFALIFDPDTGHCTRYNVPDSTTFVDGWTDACRWIHERRLISIETGRNQLRLYSVHIYTDDPVFSIVGTNRLLRGMRIWNQVTTDWDFRTVIARKRQDDKWARVSVGLDSISTSPWVLSPWPLKRLLGLFTS